MEQIVPSRKMKKIFKWWWGNLSLEEQERLRGVLYDQYAKAEGIPVEGVKDRVKEIERRRREATAKAKGL
jgi:hypothetical protein